MGKVEIIDTTFRDAHQSLIATRLRTEDMLPPIAEKMDRIGFYSMEVWGGGGATFDVCIRYLREDPLGEAPPPEGTHKEDEAPDASQGGQNLVGYRHYPDDVVESSSSSHIRTE